jgi:hypothetical protein
MITSQNTTTTSARSTLIRRLAAGAVLAAAPALIALGTATASHADTGTAGANTPSVSAPSHPAFPHQNTNADRPGTPSHHHHQWHHAH